MPGIIYTQQLTQIWVNFPHQPHQATQAILSHPQQISHPPVSTVQALQDWEFLFVQEAMIHTVSSIFEGFQYHRTVK